MKNIDYEFTRGDTSALKKFRIINKDSKIVDLGDVGQIYFTVKTDSNSTTKLIQKTLNNGIEQTEDKFYHIVLEPADTSKLNYGDYHYDIELKTTEPKTFVKTLFSGVITLTDEITWEGDE